LKAVSPSVLRRFVGLVLLIFILSACQGVPSFLEQPPTLAPTPTVTHLVKRTATPTALPTLTMTPAASRTSTITPTSTPPLLVEAGAPLPANLPSITLESAGQVSGLAEWYEQAVTDLAWVPDSSILAVASSENVNLYQLETRSVLRTLYPEKSGIVDITFSPNGDWLLAGCRQGDEKNGFVSSLEMWRGPNWKPVGLIYGSDRALTSMTFSPDSKWFIAAYASRYYSENFVDVWNTLTWTITDTLQTGTALEAAFSTDGTLLAVTPDRYAVRIWDFKERHWAYRLPTSFTGAVTRMAFSPDGVTLATGHYDGIVRLWNIPKGTLLLEFDSGSVVQSLTFSPDARMLASGGSYENSLVQIWSSGSGKLLRKLDSQSGGISSLTFSPTSQYLVSASYDGTLRLWGIRP
jgi:WD40 repeat protein